MGLLSRSWSTPIRSFLVADIIDNINDGSVPFQSPRNPPQCARDPYQDNECEVAIYKSALCLFYYGLLNLGFYYCSMSKCPNEFLEKNDPISFLNHFPSTSMEGVVEVNDRCDGHNIRSEEMWWENYSIVPSESYNT